jgi:uncharacterized membrane protein
MSIDLQTEETIPTEWNTGSEHTVYELFKWSVIVKGLVSLAEVIAGAVLLLVPQTLIVSTLHQLSTWLLMHIPVPVVTRAATELAHFGTNLATFVALYILGRGLIKCVLVWKLLQNKLWAYPALFGVMLLLLVYQLYEIATAHSIFVISITVFDVIVMGLIWHEWHIVKAHHKPASSH